MPMTLEEANDTSTNKCQCLDENGEECGAESIATATIEAVVSRRGKRRDVKITVEVCVDHIVSSIQDFRDGRAAIHDA